MTVSTALMYSKSPCRALFTSSARGDRLEGDDGERRLEGEGERRMGVRVRASYLGLATKKSWCACESVCHRLPKRRRWRTGTAASP